MNEAQEEFQVSLEEEELLRVMQMLAAAILPMVMKTAIELDLFEIMVKVNNGGGEFTSSDIVSHLPARNSQTIFKIERILKYLASKSILTSKIVTDQNEDTKKLYSMTRICKYFVNNEDGVSFANFFLFQNDEVFTESWYYLKDAILEGGTPFDKAHGENIFTYLAKDKRFSEIFNKAMYSNTAILMKMVLEKYKGFEGVEEVVDVGGGLGATLGIIRSKYPNIKGVNFDMPHVLKDAPQCPGVKHVGGDMFQSVPKGDVIFMKWILHDWGDDYCIKLLKNCWAALPEYGKVVVLETIVPNQQLPENGKTNVMSNLDGDMVMLAINPGGKERTAREYEALAIESGFASSKIVCGVSFYSIMEFYK
nr:caffeic acid 3-O-methyltransferase-like [Tanacetum cinerariifolium]